MWSERAAISEDAVLVLHLRRVWALPGTALAVNTSPAMAAHRLYLGWNYWWQAHLLDCLVDAELCSSELDRQDLIA